MPAPRTARRLGAAALVAAVSWGGAVAVAPAAHAAPAAGTLVLIGGGISPGEPTSDAILTRVIDEARPHAMEAGRDTPVVAIVSAGSPPAPNATEASDGDAYDNASANGLYYGAWFEALGAETLLVPIDQHPGEDYPGDDYSRDRAGDAALAQAIASGADAVYLGGGDQARYVRALMDCAAAAHEAFTACTDTPVLAALRGVVDGGGVVAGSSAGLAIQQGGDMITGGEPYDSWRDGTTPGVFDDDRLSHIPAGGFGFFTEGLVDSHFARRDRQPRIARLALDLGRPVAYGVEEYTALVVDRTSRTGSVIGDLGVSVLDVSGAAFDGEATADGIDASYLTPGSTIDFASGELVLAGSPRTAPGTGAKPARHQDLWGSYSCEGGIDGTLRLSQGLVASSADRASGDTCDAPGELPRFRTTVSRTAATSWNDTGGFAHLSTTFSPIPDLEVRVSANGTPPGERPRVEEGEAVTYRITVVNSGETALDGFEVATDGPGLDAANRPEAPAGELQPGESFALDVSGDTSLVELDVAVTARALDRQHRVIGAEIGSGDRNGAATASAGIVVIPSQGEPAGPEEPSDPEAPAGPDRPATPAAPAELPATGSTAPLGGALLAGILLAAAGALLARRTARGGRA